jgi:hypothetical protein
MVEVKDTSTGGAIENTSLLSKIRLNSQTIRALVDENDDLILRLYAELIKNKVKRSPLQPLPLPLPLPLPTQL